MGALQEFKEFVVKGNVIDIAVGIVIGLAFNAVISALVNGLVLPLVSLPGHVDFSGWAFTVNAAHFTPGSVLGAIITFLVIALVIFFAVVKPLQMYKARHEAPEAPPVPMRDCPECLSEVPKAARRCRYCSSPLT